MYAFQRWWPSRAGVHAAIVCSARFCHVHVELAGWQNLGEKSSGRCTELRETDAVRETAGFIAAAAVTPVVYARKLERLT